MGKERRTSWTYYLAWHYESEIEKLNQASDQGWQLVRGGGFLSKFVRDPSLRYRYQLDRRRVEEMGRYIETFREQGWEYVNSTFNHWHYFRKRYDPALPEEEYEIFTDLGSLREMNGSLAKIPLIIGVFLLTMALLFGYRFLRLPTIPGLATISVWTLEAAVLLWGAWLLCHPDSKHRKRSSRSLTALFFILLILGSSIPRILGSMRPQLYCKNVTEDVQIPLVDMRWTDFEIRYRDNYILSVTCEAKAPLTFSIVDEGGRVLYTQTGTDLQVEAVCLCLPKGHYWCTISCEAGFVLETALE